MTDIVRQSPRYTHICRDAAGLVLGTAYVYDHMGDDQRSEISRNCDGVVIRSYAGDSVEVFLPVRQHSPFDA